MRNYLLILFSLVTLNIFAQKYRAELAPRIINVNGKFGVLDQTGKTVINPENDTIIASIKDYLDIPTKQINPVFFIRRNNKYAFAYQINMDTTCDAYNFPKNKIRWFTSEFLFDKIEHDAYIVERYNYTYNNSFGSQPYYVLKYQLNGKCGLIYIPCHDAVDYSGLQSYRGYPAYLGTSQVTEAKCDSIGKLHYDGFYDVKVNGKWTLWEVIATPSNLGYNNGKQITKKWVDRIYSEYFDSPPQLVGYVGGNYSPWEFKQYYRYVKKGGKWGIIQLNQDRMEMKYIASCDCDTVDYTRYNSDVTYSTERSIGKGVVFLCEKRAQQKAVFYFNADSMVIDLKGFPPIYNLYALYPIDTLIDTKQDKHLVFTPLEFGVYDKALSKVKNRVICLIDLSRRKKTFFVEDDNTTYNLHYGHHGILIEKQTKTERGIQYEYTDFETGTLKLVIKPKLNFKYLTWVTGYREITNDYVVIKEEKGDNALTAKYYYNFRTKKFRKGRCKGCE